MYVYIRFFMVEWLFTHTRTDRHFIKTFFLQPLATNMCKFVEKRKKKKSLILLSSIQDSGK